MTVVLPGDIVHVPAGTSVRVGPGLLRGVSISGADEGTPRLVATKAGTLGSVSDRGKGVEGRWVEQESYRYVPQPGDSVVCQITNRNPETYVCTLLTSYHLCALPVLSFEGATKRSKPNLKVGTLIYAKVVQSDRHSEPELTCVDPRTGKSEGLGELRVGEREEGICTIFNVSIGLATSLLSPSHPLLKTLSSHFTFEVAIGHNGIVWVRSATPRQLIAVGKVLKAADEAPPPDAADARELVKLRGRLSDAAIKAIVQQFVT